MYIKIKEEILQQVNMLPDILKSCFYNIFTDAIKVFFISYSSILQFNHNVDISFTSLLFITAKVFFTLDEDLLWLNHCPKSMTMVQKVNPFMLIKPTINPLGTKV